MRIILFFLALLLPIQAFCAKNFFSGPNERELHVAYLVLSIAVVFNVLLHYIYFKTKWLGMKIFNIFILIVFCGVSLIALLFSPPASIFAFILVITSFIISFQPNKKQPKSLNEE